MIIWLRCPVVFSEIMSVLESLGLTIYENEYSKRGKFYLIVNKQNITKGKINLNKKTVSFYTFTPFYTLLSRFRQTGIKYRTSRGAIYVSLEKD